jgi:alpha-aminoadipate carrier protein LysW
MTDCCIDCTADLEVPEDVLEGEIISCPDCGLDYVIEIENNMFFLKQLTCEGEDWGE